MLSTQDGENWNFPCGTHFNNSTCLFFFGTKSFLILKNIRKKLLSLTFDIQKRIFYQNEKNQMIEDDVTNDIWFGFNEDEAIMLLMPTFSFIFLQVLTYTCINLSEIKMFLCFSRRELNHFSPKKEGCNKNKFECSKLFSTYFLRFYSHKKFPQNSRKIEFTFIHFLFDNSVTEW